MAKKDKIKNFAPEQEAPVQEETLFESEAYGNPQPDAGMETTVMKPIGIGGPVPIVAPKHNTIQLQPIIVPLAVVPYMTQDSDVLRTDGDSEGGMSAYDLARARSGFSAVEEETKKKKKSDKAGVRAASFFGFLLSAVAVVIYLLAFFAPIVWIFDFTQFNVIGTVINWIGGQTPQNLAMAILLIVSAGFAVIAMLSYFITLCAGKMSTGFSAVVSFLAAATVDAALIYTAVTASQNNIAFDVIAYLEYIILAGVLTLSFVLSIIELIAIGRKKDPYEDALKSNNLI